MPLALLGTKVIIHEKPSERRSWAPHGLDGWYVGHALEHYRCYKIFVAATAATRVSDTVEFFPRVCQMPRTSFADAAKQAARDLIHALLHPKPAAPDGNLYCGVTLKWDYQARTVNLSMPGYVAAAIHKFQHTPQRQPCHAPSSYNKPQYGVKVQLKDPIDTTPSLTEPQTKRLQLVVGTFLFYARAVDSTMLLSLNALAAAQKNSTQATVHALVHFLNYCATHPDATLRYRASDMILHIHSDAAYLNETEARSRVGGHHFLGDRATPINQPTNQAMEPFLTLPKSSNILSHPPQKLKLEQPFSMEKKLWPSALHLQKWATHNLPLPCKLTIPTPTASSMEPSNNNALALWICVSIG
jgi:hypothetical protein